MTLEEILKSLKKGEIRQYETVDDCHRVIKVFRFDDGTYMVYLGDIFIRAVYRVGSIENVLKQINDRFFEHWTEFDYEIYKERLELKEENAQLKKALELACDCIECSSFCPLYSTCNKNDCFTTLYKYFLKKADEELK